MNVIYPSLCGPFRRKLQVLALAAALGASACAPAWAADPRASQFYEDALARFEKKDHKGAIVQLKNAIKLDSNMLPVHVLLGRALLADGQVNAAEVAFNEALKLGVSPGEVILLLGESVVGQGNPDQLLSQPRFAHASLPNALKAKLLLLKATAASDLGQAREALRYLDEARTIDAGNSDSWSAEVPIRLRARQMPEAQAAAAKAVALDPKSPRAAYQQASVAHVSGDLKTALVLYARTLELRPDHLDSLVARAGIYIDLNRMDDAATDVALARKASPTDPRATYLAALVAERRGNTAEVKKALTEVTNLLDPYPLSVLRYRPQVLMLGGLSHFALDQYEKAKPYLELVLRQDANSPVSKLLANIYLREKRVDKAAETLETYLRQHPNDAQARMLLASALMTQGRHARAAQLMEEGLKGGDSPQMRTLLGVSLVNMGRFEPGAAQLEATLKRDPSQVQAGVTLAGLYISSGQAARAAEIADALFKRQPKNPGLANLLGSAHAARGAQAEARAAFEQALQLDPNFTEPQLNLARLDIDQKKHDAAQKRLNALLAKDEKNVEASMEIARLFSALGKTDEALRWLTRADANSGQRIAPGLQLVEFNLARGRPDLAQATIRRLQDKAPDALAVLLAQARVQLANKQVNEAKATLTRTSTQMSFDAAALVQVAELQVLAGNVPGAAHALEKALSARPDHLRARVMRSTVHLMQGEPVKAEQLARSVLASEPKLAVGHTLMGDVARYRGQVPAATESYKRAQTLEPSSQNLLALFSSLEPTQRPAALALAEQWLKSRRDDVAVWRALADSHLRTGELPAAKLAYENVIRVTPQDADALNNLAITLVGLQDAGALQVAERALKIKPEAAYVIGTAGWAAFHAKQPERALQLLRDARLRDPDNPATRYFLGTVLAQQGKPAAAREELDAALRSGANFAYAKQAQEVLKSLK